MGQRQPFSGRFWRTGLLWMVLAGSAASASAQSGERVGTRAQGMAGAFVGVADDASAVYWNPAGLARGAYFSLVLDGTTADSAPDSLANASKRSSWLVALTTPALGLSYYRLHTSAATPAAGGAAFRLDSLTSQHIGATVVQSLTDGIAVGTTVKLVRGLAASADVPALSAEDAIEDWDVAGHSSNRFDFDAAVMASGSFGRLGLVVRNVTEPGFDTGGNAELRLERQVRAGGSLMLLQNWVLAADVDLTSQRSPLGDVRELSVGTEAQFTRRFAARTGVRLNTTGDHGRTPAASFGASYGVLSSFQVDAQATIGSETALKGWGLAGRVVF